MNRLLIPGIVATVQYIEIISAPDAWLIAEDSGEEEDESPIDRELKPTNSARRVKALVEQVTGMLLDSMSHSYIYRTSTLQIATRPYRSSYSAHVSSSSCNCRSSSNTTRESQRP